MHQGRMMTGGKTRQIILVLILFASSMNLAFLASADYDINAPSSFEASGVVWHSRLDKLFTNDDGGRVLRMDRDGTNQTLWNVPGDLEGICIPDPATDLIYLGLEYDGGHLTPAIIEFNFTSGAVQRTFYLNLPGATASAGLEALTFVPNASHPQGGEFYVGHQGNGDIYTFDLPIVTGGGSGSTYNHNHTIVTNRTDLAGLHYNATGRVLDALFDSFNKIQVIRLNGSVIHEFDLAAKAGYSEDEGIGEDNMGHLYIARENGAEGMISVLGNYLDITGPKVRSVELSDPSPTRAGDVIFTVGFDEPANTNFQPKVAFAKASPFTAHILSSIGWVNSTHWRGHFAIDGSTGDGWNNISVSGAMDIIGNLMEPDWNHSFIVDTKLPGIRSIVPSSATTVGAHALDFRIEFDEPMDKSFEPKVTFSTANPYLSNVVSPVGWLNDTAWAGNAIISSATGDGLNHIRITGAVDPANNTMHDDWNNTFRIDTTGPSVRSVELSDPAPVKAGAVNITVQFNEPMNITGAPPAVSFGLVGPFDRNVITSTGWSNSTAWTGKFVVNGSTGDGLNHLRIAGASDVFKNVMSPDTSFTFDVDALRPSVSSVRMNPATPLTEGQVSFTIEFSEPMDVHYSPTAEFGQPVADHELTPVGWSDDRNWTGVYAINGSTGDGRFGLSVSGAQDVAGNPMIDHLGPEFEIDTIAPVSKVDALQPYFNVDHFTLGASANDSGTGVALVEYFYRLNGGSDYSRTPQEFVASVDGHYDFYSVATDKAGNMEAPPGEPDASTTVDTRPPVVSKVTFDRSGPYNSSTWVTVLFSEVVNSSLLKVTYMDGSTSRSVAGRSVGLDKWEGEIAIEDKTPPNGTYTLNIAGATDRAGNLQVPDSSTKFVVQWPVPPKDVKPPTVVSLSNDRNPPVGLGRMNITIVFSENMDVTVPLSVGLWSNDGSGHPLNGTWKDERTWTGSVVVTKSWADGIYTYSIKGGKDRAGNPMLENKEHTVDVRIDRSRPHQDDGWGLVQWSIAIIVAVVACIVAGILLFAYGRRRKGAPSGTRPSGEATKVIKEEQESDSKD